MKQSNNEIKNLKNHHIDMWNLVQEQTNKAYSALLNNDEELAKDVIAHEKVVDAQELLVDHHCEDFIALFAPVAVDLRLVLSLIKITNNLERIADFAEHIALFVIKNKPINKELQDKLCIEEMFKITTTMLENAREALVNEDSSLCRKVIESDNRIDDIHSKAIETLAQEIQTKSDEAFEMIHIYSLVRRIERIGDRISNIAENTAFFIDAKELRHQKI